MCPFDVLDPPSGKANACGPRSTSARCAFLAAAAVLFVATYGLCGSRNYVPNGDLEVGCGHGVGTAQQERDYSIADMWDTTQAHSGKASMRIPPWGNVVTRAIPVPPHRMYTVSAWVKPVSGKASVKLGVSNDSKELGAAVLATATTAPSTPGASRQAAAPEGHPSTNLEETFTLQEGWQQIKISGVLEEFPTSDYHIKITCFDDAVWVDQIQLEEGPLSEFKAGAPMEIGLVCGKVSHIFMDSEKVSMKLLAHNASRQPLSKKIGYELYDYLNRKVKSGSVAVQAQAGQTSQTELDLGTGQKGVFRAVLWVDEEDGTEEEIAFSVVAPPRIDGPDPSSMIGIHASASDTVLTAAQKLGIKWQRALSPAAWMRWELAETEPGKFTWRDDAVKKTVDHGFQILGCIHGWAKWAAKDDWDAWEKYVYATVEHYKGSVKNWEICNEPIYQYKDGTGYVELLKRAARAIRKADPNARIIGMGGSYEVMWQLKVIEGLGGRPKEFMDLISTHLYPPGADPYNPSHDTRAFDYHEKILVPHQIEVWNTETGAWCDGIYQGANSNYRLVGENTSQASRPADTFFRGFNFEAERVVYNFMHTIGNGMTAYYYYDARVSWGPDYYKTHCTILQYDDTIKTKGIAYGVLAWLFDHCKGMGNLTAVPKSKQGLKEAASETGHDVGDLGSDIRVYAYLFDRSGVPLVAIWSSDTKNRTLALGLSPQQVKAYDMMGNEMTLSGGALSFGRSPVYLEGQNKLTIEQMKAAIQKGRLQVVPDSTPPNLSISEAPRGIINESTLRMRWIAADDTYVPAVKGAGDPHAVVYSHRLVGCDKDWSEWMPKTVVIYQGLTPGKYRLEVKARDGAGNVCEPVAREFTVQRTGATG